MAIFKVLILFNFLFGAHSLYWNWTETGETFDRGVPTLYGLRIPQSLLKQMPICNQSCSALQRSSLVSFYESTCGPKWVKRRNWNTDVFYCDWEGILCYNRTFHIIAIDLQGNNGMQGFVGTTLGRLPYLLGVDMGGSRLQGDVRDLLGTLKSFFIRFDFANNDIHGEFPQNIATAWPHLGKIQISGNKAIYGTIPENIYLLKDLQVLSLGETGISGWVPKRIANLSNLYFLDLEALSLKGDLGCLKGLSKLRFIHLMSNQLEGEFPKDFGNWFSDLFELLLQGNDLSGDLPSSLGNFSGLSLLQLSENKRLTGRIPLSFSNLKSLEIFDISNTQIEGFEKGLVLGSKKLSSFVAKRNKKFSESIYSLVGALGKSGKSLNQLDVQDCDIYGRFDKVNDDSNLKSGIFRFSKLVFLNLGGNKHLSGSIPDPISSLGLIVFFNASCTNTSDALPVSYLIKLKLLQEIDIRKNPLMKGEIEEKYMLVDDTEMIAENVEDNIKCPVIRLKHNNCLVRMDSAYYERRYCQCNPGFYGHGGTCRSCMTGGVCDGLVNRMSIVRNDSRGKYSKDFTVTSMKPAKGYWPFPTMKNVTKLVKCRWTLPGKEVCNPSGLVRCYAKKVSGQVITVCGSDEHVCAEGSYGRLCSRCKQGYYSTGQHCHKCLDSKDKESIITIVLAAVMITLLGLSMLLHVRNRRIFAALLAIFEAVAVLILAIMGIIPSWLADINILIFLLAIGGFGKFGKGLLKTAVFYMQIIDALVASTHIWPTAVYFFSDFISSLVNLRFSVLGCRLPKIFTPQGKLFLLMLLPLCLCMVLATASFLFRMTARHKLPDTYEKFKYKCAHLSILFLNLSYFPLVKATFSVLVPCKQVEGISYMPNYVWIDCNSSEYKLLYFVALFCIVLYVIGVPVLFLSLLRWQREHIVEGHLTTSKWLGSLYIPYKPNYRVLMEFFLMLRRTFLAFLITFIDENVTVKTTLVSAVFFISLILETHAKPFRTADGNDGCWGFGMENIIEITMLSVLLFSFIAAQTSIQTNSEDQNLLWSVIIINAIFSFVLIMCFLKRLGQREGGYEQINEGERANEGFNQAEQAQVMHD
ncbi:putative leucine-rich repeat-containing protein DDB_G0281931 [Rhopilema esculentum]|uniref:putative leucine-rich repeat-containing protein DDB_G0281931 n=1 Tax=Rhopilema esculentum TaxID=499914 RepID=UPI0031D725B8